MLTILGGIYRGIGDRSGPSVFRAQVGGGQCAGPLSWNERGGGLRRGSAGLSLVDSRFWDEFGVFAMEKRHLWRLAWLRTVLGTDRGPVALKDGLHIFGGVLA